MNQTPNLTLVTGGSGFVGNNLVRHLLSLGRRVRVFSRRASSSLADLDVEVIIGDLFDADLLETAMRDVDVVYHLAAVISIDRREDRALMTKVNVEGARTIVEASIKQGVRRFVQMSSVHAFSYAPRNKPIDESRRLADATDKNALPYDVSKAAGQRIVTDACQRGLDAVVLNPVGIIGPNDFDPSPAGEMILQLVDRRLPGLVRAGYFWIDARDVAIAAVAAEVRGKRGECYLLKGEYASFSTIAKHVQQATGVRPPRINAPLWLARMVAPIDVWLSSLAGRRPLVTPESIEIVSRHQQIETDKAENELGIQYRPLKTTIADTIAWFQSRHVTASSSHNNRT